MTHLGMLIAALLIDGLVGDPEILWRRLPHPAALMGRAVSLLEQALNRGGWRRIKGALAMIALVTVSGGIGCAVAALPYGHVFEIAGAAILLAQNSLARHVAAVARALEVSLPAGRKAVAMIVGRDPDALDRGGVARSAIESAAENLSDGVIAPAFWFLLAGLPGIMIYKAVNTADSMVGYRTPRFEAFGWAAARLDDLLNWVPARIAGLLICAAHLSWGSFRVMLRDAPLHRSPNAGWPEAAAAAVIGVAISGPRMYDGCMVEYPFVHAEGRRDPTPGDIDAVVRLNWRTWALTVVLLIMAAGYWGV